MYDKQTCRYELIDCLIDYWFRFIDTQNLGTASREATHGMHGMHGMHVMHGMHGTHDLASQPLEPPGSSTVVQEGRGTSCEIELGRGA